MRKLLKDKTGSVPVLTFGFVFVLLILTFLTVEMGSTYENYDYCMDVLQRSCNSAVEANIDDTYRADKVLILLSLVQTEREPCVRQLLDDTFI